MSEPTKEFIGDLNLSDGEFVDEETFTELSNGGEEGEVADE